MDRTSNKNEKFWNQGEKMRLRSLSRVFRGIYISYALLAMTIGTVSWAGTEGMGGPEPTKKQPQEQFFKGDINQVVTESEFDAMIERIRKQPRVWKATVYTDHEVANDMARTLLTALMRHYEIIGYETDYGFEARMFAQLRQDIAQGKIQDGGVSHQFFQLIANLDALFKEAQQALDDLEKLRTEEVVFKEEKDTKERLLTHVGAGKIEAIGKALHVIFIEMMDKIRRASYASGEWTPPLPTPQRVKAASKTIAINQDLFSSLLSYYADTLLDLIAALKTFKPMVFKVFEIKDGQIHYKEARIHPYGFNWYGDDAFYTASEQWLRTYESRDRKFRERLKTWENRIINPNSDLRAYEWWHQTWIGRLIEKWRKGKGNPPASGGLGVGGKADINWGGGGSGGSSHESSIRGLMVGVRVNPDGSVAVEGESAVETMRRGFGEAADTIVRSLHLGQATGETMRDERGREGRVRRFGIRGKK